jgi:hypothetical protein
VNLLHIWLKRIKRFHAFILMLQVSSQFIMYCTLAFTETVYWSWHNVSAFSQELCIIQCCGQCFQLMVCSYLTFCLCLPWKYLDFCSWFLDYDGQHRRQASAVHCTSHIMSQ